MDADWVNCFDGKRSVNGYCTMHVGNLASWSSSKQKVVAQLASEAVEVTWITTLLGQLELSFKQLPRLMCNNISAQHITKNPV